MNPLAISVPEAGRLLGISRNLAYQAAQAGEIPTVRIGRRLVVPVSRLMDLLGNSDAGPKADAANVVPAIHRTATEKAPHG